jgi:uncharacterized protein (UPF0335 family)
MNIEYANDVEIDTTADELHSVREKIKVLEAEEKALKEEIIARHIEVVEGYNVKAVVTWVPESKTTDWKAVCSFVKVKAEILARFAKTKVGHHIVNIRPL